MKIRLNKRNKIQLPEILILPIPFDLDKCPNPHNMLKSYGLKTFQVEGKLIEGTEFEVLVYSTSKKKVQEKIFSFIPRCVVEDLKIVRISKINQKKSQ